MTTAVKQFKHPYLTINRNVRGGEPIVSVTGIRVLDIAIRYEVMGMTPEDIVVALPHLTLAQVHDALSYYYEHKDEIDRKWKEAIKSVEAIKKTTPSILEKKIVKIKSMHR